MVFLYRLSLPDEDAEYMFSTISDLTTIREAFQFINPQMSPYQLETMYCLGIIDRVTKLTDIPADDLYCVPWGTGEVRGQFYKDYPNFDGFMTIEGYFLDYLTCPMLNS